MVRTVENTGGLSGLGIIAFCIILSFGSNPSLLDDDDDDGLGVIVFFDDSFLPSFSLSRSGTTWI